MTKHLFFYLAIAYLLLGGLCTWGSLTSESMFPLACLSGISFLLATPNLRHWIKERRAERAELIRQVVDRMKGKSTTTLEEARQAMGARIYSRVLSATEITKLYNRERGR